MPEAKRITQQGVVTSVYLEVKAGWEQWILLQSDNHHDSIKCSRELETAHLEEAKRRNAWVMIFGDLFDAMQGRFDPRRSMDELRPEYRREDYYDFVVSDIGKYLAPYAQNLLMITDGNHELSVLKNANTYLPDRLVSEYLNRRSGGHVVHGAYGGWVRFMFESAGKPMMSVKLKYFHGSGGEAPVTRGVIQTNRQAVYLPDADVVVNGHSHNSYYVPISRERIGGKGKQFFDIQHHVRIPGYKQDYGDGSTGWDVTRGGVPKPIGAVWMRMYFDNGVQLQFIPDIRGAEPVSVAPAMFTGVVFDER
jgi:predicted phosphodiesterase